MHIFDVDKTNRFIAEGLLLVALRSETIFVFLVSVQLVICLPSVQSMGYTSFNAFGQSKDCDCAQFTAIEKEIKVFYNSESRDSNELQRLYQYLLPSNTYLQYPNATQ